MKEKETKETNIKNSNMHVCCVCPL